MVKDLSRQEKQIEGGMVDSAPVKAHHHAAKDAHWPLKELSPRGFWEQERLLGATSGSASSTFPQEPELGDLDGVLAPL